MRVSESLEYLLSTDESYGQLRGSVSGLEYLIKTAEAEGYKNATGTQDERKSIARTTDNYKTKVKEYMDTRIEMEITAAKRKTAELHIEVWRTQQANKRQGNI